MCGMSSICRDVAARRSRCRYVIMRELLSWPLIILRLHVDRVDYDKPITNDHSVEKSIT
jgi:hypothetical protein